MAIPVGRTLFKKKDGILTLTPDQQTVTWTPNSGGPATVTLPVSKITSTASVTPLYHSMTPCG
jgi:transcription initiation factor TFIIH subunit 1